MSFFGSPGNVIVVIKPNIQEKSLIMDRADRLNGVCVGGDAGCLGVCNRVGGISNGEVFTFVRVED